MLAIGCATDIVDPSRDKPWWSAFILYLMYGRGRRTNYCATAYSRSYPCGRADGSLTYQYTRSKPEPAHQLGHCAPAALARCHQCQCRSGTPSSLSGAGPAGDEETRVPHKSRWDVNLIVTQNFCNRLAVNSLEEVRTSSGTSSAWFDHVGSMNGIKCLREETGKQERR